MELHRLAIFLDGVRVLFVRLEGVGQMHVCIRIVRAQADLFRILCDDSRDVPGRLHRLGKIAMIVGGVGRELRRFFQFSDGFVKIAGLAQDEAKIFM